MSDFGSMPVGPFIAQLNIAYNLGFDSRYVERCAKVFNDQWFGRADELKNLDLDAFTMLDLPESLYKAVHAVFQAGRFPTPPVGAPPQAVQPVITPMPMPVPVPQPQPVPQPIPPSYYQPVPPQLQPQVSMPMPVYPPQPTAMPTTPAMWPPMMSPTPAAQPQPVAIPQVAVPNPFPLYGNPWPSFGDEFKPPAAAAQPQPNEDVLAIPPDLIAPGPPSTALRRLLEFILKESVGDDAQLTYIKYGLSHETDRGTPITKTLLRGLLRDAAAQVTPAVIAAATPAAAISSVVSPPASAGITLSPSADNLIAPVPSYASLPVLSPSVSSRGSITSVSSGAPSPSPSPSPMGPVIEGEMKEDPNNANPNLGDGVSGSPIRASSAIAAPAASSNDAGEGTASTSGSNVSSNPFAMPFAPSEGMEVKVPVSSPLAAPGGPSGPFDGENKGEFKGEAKAAAPVVPEVKEEVKDPTTVCGICRGAKDTPTFLDCSHLFCQSCLRSLILELVEQKNVVGMACPFPGCRKEMSQSNIKALLSPADFERYDAATLAAFIDGDRNTVVCPKAECKAPLSFYPLASKEVKLPITETTDDGKVLTKEAFLHFKEYRLRCRNCATIFCAGCSVTPYHKGYTCALYVEYLKARHCRFCGTKMDITNNAGYSGGLKDCCNGADCMDKAKICCDKIKACGCPCNGVRGEPAADCLPCLKHELKCEEDFCSICYVESLKDAPCIKLTGPCKHVFHFACVQKKLEARWPSARVGFEFRCCPTCKLGMEHPALMAQLSPILELERGIQTKALQRLKYESKDKDSEVTTPGGDYYQKPLEYAMKIYLFFMCWTCKKPYFAGGYQCQEASDAFDPKELICPACQPSSVVDCPTHGKDWLAYKCRYCCNIANWFCWGNTHFCDNCVAVGTPVSLASGYSVPIEELEHNDQEVLTYDAAQNGITTAKQNHWWNKDVQDCVQLLFSDGRTLICTPDHRIRTTRGDVTAETLAIGDDKVICGGDQPVFATPNAAELVIERTWSLHTGGMAFSAATPAERQRAMTFSRIVGFILTDGSVSRSYVAAFIGHEMDVADFIRDIRTLEPDVGDIRSVWQDNGSGWAIYLPSRLATAIRELDGMVMGRRSEQAHQWPDFVHTLPKCLLREFIGGLFGGDGHTLRLSYVNKQYYLRAIRFTLSSTTEHKRSLKKMLTQLKGWLENVFGIAQQSIRETLTDEGKHAISVRVSDTAIVQFANQIGFRYCVHKANRLAAGVSWRRLVDISIVYNHRVTAMAYDSCGYAAALAKADEEAAKCKTANEKKNAKHSAMKLNLKTPMLDAYDRAIAKLTKDDPSFHKSFVTITRRSFPRSLEQMHKKKLRGSDKPNKAKAPMHAKAWLEQIGAYHLFKSDLEKKNDDDGDDDDDDDEDDDTCGWTDTEDTYLLSLVDTIGYAKIPIPTKKPREPKKDAADDNKEVKKEIVYGESKRGGGDDDGIKLAPIAQNDEWAGLDSKEPIAADGDGVKKMIYGVPRGQNHLPFYLLTVVKRKAVGPTQVYDISVPGTELFAANGIIVHNCHKSGVWQKLATFRTGANKKKLWEYDQCKSLKAPVASIGNDKKLNDEAKEKAIGALLSTLGTCSMTKRHPPAGLEFGIGCSMCENSNVAQDAKAPDPSKPQAAPAATPGGAAATPPALMIDPLLLKSRREAVKGLLAAGRVFTYAFDFDTNGVMYFLGTMGLSQPWVNPSDAGWVIVTTSGLMQDSTPPSAAVGRETVRCVTQPVPNSWFCFDLTDLSLAPSAYSLRHYSSWDNECLRHWVLEGSNDGLSWDALVTHTNDPSLEKKGATKSWRIVNPSNRRFRMFRVLQTGRNSNHNFYLPCSGFELYGSLFSSVPSYQAEIEKAEMKDQTFIPFNYAHDFDTNGICYYLGTRNGTAPWTNPGELGIIKVTCSELASQPPSAPCYAVVGRETVRCVSANKPDQWFIIDFKEKRIQPSHYTMRHYSSWDLEALRNWRFEGSNDGRNWVVLRTHIEDKGLDFKGATHTWQIENQRGAYSMFRVYQTGNNSNNHLYLALSGFEVYGKLYLPQEEKERPGQVLLRYAYDFDQNGLFYWLGSKGKTVAWTNPGETGIVHCTASTLAIQPPSKPAWAICGRETVRCVTLPQPKQWMAVDLRDKRIQPSHYTLRHYDSWDSEALRTWQFEGSVDGGNWDILRAHYNDGALNKKGATHTWVITNAPKAYRFLRIAQTGVNSNNNHYLSLSGLEVYGVLTDAVTPGGAAGAGGSPAVAVPPSGAGLQRAGSVSLPPGVPFNASFGGGAIGGPPMVPGGVPGGPPGGVGMYGAPTPSPIGGPAMPPPGGAMVPSPYGVPPAGVPGGMAAAPLPAPGPFLPFADGQEFKYSADFDRNGILYWLGTNRYTTEYKNPALTGLVRATSAPLATQPPSAPAAAAFGRDLVRCVTLPMKEAWFAIDMVNFAVLPTAYTLRHYDSWDTEALRDWKLQGSNDGKKWHKLFSHKKEEALNRKGASHTWVLPKTKKPYRHFRILQTGKNSNGHWFCAMSGFEVYGQIYALKK